MRLRETTPDFDETSRKIQEVSERNLLFWELYFRKDEREKEDVLESFPNNTTFSS